LGCELFRTSKQKLNTSNAELRKLEEPLLTVRRDVQKSSDELNASRAELRKVEERIAAV
jgi:septal ring factor EnvC (AmiA/AmiB activator)